MPDSRGPTLPSYISGIYVFPVHGKGILLGLVSRPFCNMQHRPAKPGLKKINNGNVFAAAISRITWWGSMQIRSAGKAEAFRCGCAGLTSIEGLIKAAKHNA
jgi:hypothetical protein